MACTRIADSGMKVEAESRFFATPAFPPGSGPDYVNATISVTGADGPVSLLRHLHRIEAEFGRERRQRWAGRVLDLDLLAFGDQVLPDVETQRAWAEMPLEAQKTQAPDRLILPHPRLQDRAFVLVPLADIAADWRHPVTGLSVQEMLDARPEAEKTAITPL